MEMTNTNLKAFRADFAKAVAALEQQYGVKIQLGGISYDNVSFTSKITVKNPTTPIEDFRKAAIQLSHLGIKPEMYGQRFVAADGKSYTLVGLKPTARKNVCVIEPIPFEGKTYVCSTGFLGIRRAY